MRSEEEQYLDKWREKEERQSVFGARFGIELFRGALNCASVCHQSLRGEGIGPSTKDKTVSLPSWGLTLEGYTVKGDALGLEQEPQIHMRKEARQIKE